MALPTDPPRRTQRVPIVLTVLVGVLTTAVAYLGTRGNPQAGQAPPAAPAAAPSPAQTIVLPHDEAALPAGPHRKAFVTACTVCHSTRLVLTQPPFPRAKWQEIVQKMRKVFGAPIPSDEEPHIVDYLVAIRGQ